MPEWFGRLLRLDLSEARVDITAPPTVYAVLAVVPSAEEVSRALWQETRTMVTLAVVLLATLIVVLHVILAYGLRSVRKLGEIAARFGAGDLTVRMPETRVTELAPTMRAFNAMAQNLEGLMVELRAKEAANRSLAASVEQAEEAILTLDLERRVTSWNVGARRLFGRPAEAMIGHPIATHLRRRGRRRGSVGHQPDRDPAPRAVGVHPDPSGRLDVGGRVGLPAA